jgi:poly(3-hydroxybutyrate) depolymerase
MIHAAVQPLRLQNDALRYLCRSAYSPLAYTPFGKATAAASEVFENLTRRYRKPDWGIDETKIFGLPTPVEIECVKSKPFCDLLHFKRGESEAGKRYDPKVLIVAPLSGHYATLLRGTVRAMLPEHDVYVTDWRDARLVPLVYGDFDLDDFIDYVKDFLRFIGPRRQPQYHSRGQIRPQPLRSAPGHSLDHPTRLYRARNHRPRRCDG